MKLLKWIAYAIFMVCPYTHAVENMEELIVQSSRLDIPISELTSSVDIITSADLQQSGVTTVADSLKRLPSISFSQNGGPGQATAIYLRGAKPQHTLIMIDGVRINGQLDLNGYDLANLDISGVERIEIIKGPQGTLYGSDAMAGVINIITRRQPDKQNGYINIETGSYDTSRISGGIGLSNDKIYSNLDFTFFENEGFSAKKNNTERDGLINKNLNLRIGSSSKENFSFNAGLRYIDAEGDYDDGFYSDHSDYSYEKEQSIGYINTSYKSDDDKYESQVNLSFIDLDRKENLIYTETDGWPNYMPVSSSPYSAIYDADTFTYEILQIIDGSNKYSTIFSAKGSEEHYEIYNPYPGYEDIIKGKLKNIGLQVLHQYNLTKEINLYGAIRLDDHSEFNKETTHKIGTSRSWNEGKSRVFFNYGSAFKAPISYQLYSVQNGNSNLKPETSKGYEIGIEKTIFEDKYELELTYFDTQYDQLIAYNWPQYVNVNKAKTSGIEFNLGTYLNPVTKLNLGYLYLDNDSDDDTYFEDRRPNNSVNLNINHVFNDKINLNMFAGYKSSRDEGNSLLKSYKLINLSGQYKISKNINYFVRIDNVLDEEYVTAFGYNTPGQSFYTGARVQF